MLTSPNFVEDAESDAVYSLAPGQNNTPLSIFQDKDSEELAFINIFCGERRMPNTSRHVPVYYSELVRSEMRRSDRRAASCIDNIFFKTKKIQMKHLLDKVNVAMRKCKTQGVNLTAATFKDMKNIEDFVHRDVGYKFIKSVRGSPPYIEALSKDLMCMIRILGPATFFCSFSAAETQWLHLLKILSILVDCKDLTNEEASQLTWSDISRLLQADPITAARHFDYQVQCLFKMLKASNGPLGHIEDFFYRVEFQHRGR